MIYLDEFIVENGITFEKAIMPLHNQKRIFLSGKNEDTGGSNGAGKSSILELMREMLYPTTGGKGRKGALARGSDYVRQLKLRKAGKEYIIQKFMKCKALGGTGVKIYENGKDITIKGIINAEHQIQQIIGLTESEFLASVYLKQGGVHVLIEGTGADRNHFLSNLFQLDRYDLLHEHFKAREVEIANQLQDLLQLEAVLESIEVKLKEYPELNELKEELEQLDSRLTKNAAKEKTLLDSLGSLKEGLADVKTKARLRVDLEELNAADISYKDLKVEREKLGAYSEEQEKKRESLKDRIRWDKQRTQLESELNEIQEQYEFGDITAGTLKEERDSVQEKYHDVKDKIGQLQDRAELEKKYAALGDVGDLDDLKKSHHNLLDAKSKCKASLQNKQEELNHYLELAELESPKCPTCLQDVDQDMVSKQVADLEPSVKTIKKNLAKIKDDLESCSEQLDQAEQAKEMVARIEKMPKGDPDTLIAKRDKYKKRVKQLDDQIAAVGKYETLIEQLGKVPKVAEKLETLEAEMAAVDLVIEKGVKELRRLQEAATLRKQYDAIKIEVSVEDLEAEIASVEKKYAEIREKRSWLDGKHANLKAKVDQVRAYVQERKDILKKMEGMDSLRGEQRIVGGLTKAYHPTKGLKITVALRRILNAIQDILPSYTSLLFSERDIEFIVDPKENQTNFLIRRDKEDEFDIRMMSGGEKKRLYVAFILTLRDMIAATKKVDCIFLDEIDESLDDIGSQAFSREILPILASKVGTTIAISHDERVREAEYDQFWEIKKKGNISTLSVSKQYDSAGIYIPNVEGVAA